MLPKHNVLHDAPLGKKTTYTSNYQPDLLFPIPRAEQRAELGIQAILPFYGQDIWNAFEISWLNAKGKPIVAAAEFYFPATSTHLIESKSFKLYLNSFNNTCFASQEAVKTTLIKDLTDRAGAPVQLNLFSLNEAPQKIHLNFSGECLDGLDIHCDTYSVTPKFLVSEDILVTETLYSNLLKSNCPITGQPDWASVQIAYTGKKINHEGLLKYIVSYRNQNDFHEHCAERMFVEISQCCRPEKLSVYTRYTRRGGLDINSYRTSFETVLENTRLWRQ